MTEDRLLIRMIQVLHAPPSLWYSTDLDTEWTHKADSDSLLLTLNCKEVEQEKLLEKYIC